MKSAVLYGKHDLRVEDLALPTPGPNDVLVQVKVCGVCGTDVHIYEGDKGAAEVSPPVILGHEFAGVIAQVGLNVTSYRVGDRVSVDPNRYCGACDPCRNGAAHFCENMVGYGTTVNGGFAEYCAVDERQIYLLGAQTTFAQGAMAEPVACCLHGIDLCGIRPGYQVVVIGGGMVGLLMLQLAKLAGAAKVALLEPIAEKRAVGQRLGADITIDPLMQNAEEELHKAGITHANVVIECVGRPSTIEQAIALAGNKAVVMMFGLTKPDEEITVRPFTLFQKELELKASFINPYTQHRALALIDSGKLDVSSMVYQTSGLHELATILHTPELRNKGKYLIAPDR